MLRCLTLKYSVFWVKIDFKQGCGLLIRRVDQEEEFVVFVAWVVDAIKISDSESRRREARR